MFNLFRKTRDFDKIIAPILPRLKAAGVKKLGFFGSYARGEDTWKSDVDVLVDFEDAYYDYNNLWDTYEALQTVFKNKKIDLVTAAGLNPRIGPKILKTVNMSKYDMRDCV